MFDLNKLGDMSKLAAEAKKLHAEQERAQRDQIDLLRKVSSQLDEVLRILKENKSKA